MKTGCVALSLKIIDEKNSKNNPELISKIRFFLSVFLHHFNSKSAAACCSPSTNLLTTSVTSTMINKRSTRLQQPDEINIWYLHWEKWTCRWVWPRMSSGTGRRALQCGAGWRHCRMETKKNFAYVVLFSSIFFSFHLFWCCRLDKSKWNKRFWIIHRIHSVAFANEMKNKETKPQTHKTQAA